MAKYYNSLNGEIRITSVMTSCGYGVPFFDYVGEREQLKSWAKKKEKQGTLKEYMGT